MTITTRSGKGGELTWNELDGNFTDLDTRTHSGWRDIIVEINVQTGNPNAPTLNIFRDNLLAYTFTDGETKEAFAVFHVDHDYKVGSALYPHVHWSCKSTATGTVRWGFEYTLAKGHQQTYFPATTTVYVEQAADGTQYKHYVAEVSDGNAIPGTNLEVDSLVLCRVFRDGSHPNDTLADDVFVFCVDVHYQADRFATPNKAPNFYS